MRRKARNLLIIACFIVLLIICIVAFVCMNPGLGHGGSDSSNVDNSDEILLAEKENTQALAASGTEIGDEEEILVDEGEGIEEFVIFGVDTRADNLGKGTRSDSIIIVHIDYDKKTAKVLSIYRDCMVHIEDHGYEKITHAHSYGGPELALSTINENFDLDIRNYATLNFLNAADLVNKIGGVEVEIAEDEVEFLSDIDGRYCGKITEAGTYLLDGSQAVKYSRIRYTSGGDYRRSERQRTVLLKIFEIAKTMSPSDRLSLAEDMLEQINSNYETDDLISLLYYTSKYEITEMTAYPQVFYGGIVDRAWVEVPVTLVDMATGIHEFLYDETDYYPSDTVQSFSNTLQTKASTANQNLTEYEYELPV